MIPPSACTFHPSLLFSWLSSENRLCIRKIIFLQQKICDWKASYPFCFFLFSFLQAGGPIILHQYRQCNTQQELLLQNNSVAGFENWFSAFLNLTSCRISNSEMKYNGKLYDYKTVRIYGNTVELSVLNDSAEEGILEMMAAMSGADEKEQSNILPTQKLLTLNYLASSQQHFILNSEQHTVYQTLSEQTTICFLKFPLASGTFRLCRISLNSKTGHNASLYFPVFYFILTQNSNEKSVMILAFCWSH